MYVCNSFVVLCYWYRKIQFCFSAVQTLYTSSKLCIRSFNGDMAFFFTARLPRCSVNRIRSLLMILMSRMITRGHELSRMIKYEQVEDTKMNTDRCPSKYYANTRVNDFHQFVYKFAQLYSKRSLYLSIQMARLTL